MRTGAILLLGLAGDAAAVTKLDQKLLQSQPGIGIFIAWALVRSSKPGSMEREHALQYMKKIARSDSAKLAVQAIMLLRTETSAEIIRQLYDCLYSHQEAVRIAAANTLSQIEPEHHETALQGYAPERKAASSSRLALLCHLHQGAPAPEDLSGSLNSNDPEDRLLALRCIEKRKRLNDVPELILLLADASASVQNKARSTLQSFIIAKGMSGGPDDDRDQMAWCRWWLRQYRVLAATDQRALVQDPLGQTCEVTPGLRLDFRARVMTIRAGSLPEGREGARVELELSGEPVVLIP